MSSPSDNCSSQRSETPPPPPPRTGSSETGEMQSRFEMEAVESPLDWSDDEFDPLLEPPVVWCGKGDGDQDVTIGLILSGLPEEESAGLPPLAEVKVHSSRLRTCSKYFAAMLGPPCPKRKRTPLEFNLETFADESVYTDCFARMCTPFRKGFCDVNYALQLLQVATQIEFEELQKSTSRFLSSVQWSREDELKIRRYVASPRFPRNHAVELLARVEREGDRCTQIRSLIKQCVHSLGNNSSRGLLEELLKTACAPLSEGPTFEEDLAKIIKEEAKLLIEDVHVNFHTCVRWFQQVPKLRAVCCVLEVLLGALMGEEGIECFLRLENYSFILANAARSSEPELYRVARVFADLILSIGAEAMSGNLLLGIPDRVSLLNNWRPLFQRLDMTESFQLMAAALFSTLPINGMMEVIINEAYKGNYDTFICPQALATLLKDQWPCDDEEWESGQENLATE